MSVLYVYVYKYNVCTSYVYTLSVLSFFQLKVAKDRKKGDKIVNDRSVYFLIICTITITSIVIVIILITITISTTITMRLVWEGF